MPHHAPCRNRTYNLVSEKAAPGEPFPAVPEGTPTESGLRERFARSRTGAQPATKVQPAEVWALGVLRGTLALPCRAVRAGWEHGHEDLVPPDGPRAA